ncbi:hypothetical protein [Paenibacillus sp. Marseille-Q4541]|uniref:hypothetical protein n=1 Tax=Paenibacillus sp. Marseille-Q4541 TaxID=2831522 RepID=UPI001BAD408A|nr:hypothetical protein [Paenibacillus sp. Marseille-Q4541]
MMTQLRIADMMKAYAEDAVDFADQMDVKLDFSEASLKDLDSILQKFHGELPRGWRKIFNKGPSEEQIAYMAKMWGGYLGEVVVRHLGGEWKASEIVEDTIALQIGEEELYPPSRAYRRIMNGAEDSVEDYYKIQKLRQDSHNM